MASPFDMFFTDSVTLVKRSGETLEGIRASVQSGKILLPETSIPVEDGDTIKRPLKNGVVEEYEVLDSGFHSGMDLIPAGYQARVRKKSAIVPSRAPSVVYNLGDVHISGDNSRFNLHSADLSTNIVDVDTKELFSKLEDLIAQNVEDAERRHTLLGKLAGMQKAQGSPVFVERYKDFIGSAADHMTLLAPFLPALSQLLG